MDTLTIEYRNKINGLMYVQFDADIDTDSKTVDLYCMDDPTGEHDTWIRRDKLEENYTKIREYMEESIHVEK